MTYCFDLDNTLCKTCGNLYEHAVPDVDMIFKVNLLFYQGHTILIHTARGMTSCVGDIGLVYEKHFCLAASQLNKWGVKYSRLILGKPSFDVFIDDKNLSIEEFKKSIHPTIGFIAGAFDILHAGYFHLFKEAKQYCDCLIVGLHSDSSLERGKSPPIFSKEERRMALESIKYIDFVENYDTEAQLEDLIIKKGVDVLFLGDDYRGIEHNGDKLRIRTHYINRQHGWSTTKLKELICQKS